MKNFLYTLAIILTLNAGIGLVKAQDSSQDSNQELSPDLAIVSVKTTGQTDRHEFVEFINLSEEPINVEGLKVLYSPGTSDSWYSKAELPDFILEPNSRNYVATSFYGGGVAVMGSGLSKSAGSVRLVYENHVLDTVTWGMEASLTDGLVQASHTNSAMVRLFNVSMQEYIMTGNNFVDFQVVKNYAPNQEDTSLNCTFTDCEVVQIVTDETDNIENTDDIEEPQEETESQEETDETIESDEANETGEAESGQSSQTVQGNTPTASAFAGLKPIQITELLPDPASPVKDSDGEFVEIYNPNDTDIVLDGLRLQSGSSFSTNHLFGPADIMAAKTYAVVYSKDIKLSLSNSDAKVRLVLPDDSVWGPEISTGKAKAGKSYALYEGEWYWAGLQTPAKPNLAPEDLDPELAQTKVDTTADAKKAIEQSLLFEGDVETQLPAKTGTTLVASANDDYSEPNSTKTNSTIWLIIGVVGVSGVIYGLYEYRNELHTYLTKLRRHFGNSEETSKQS